MAATTAPEIGSPPVQLAATGAYGQVVGRPDGDRDSDDEKGLPVATLKKWFSTYVTAKDAEMREAREAREYYHGAQWSAEERRSLAERGQPPLTNNRVSLKIDGIVGVVDRLRMDPKAVARTEAYAAGAEIGTAAVREVLDRNRWEALRQEVSQDLAINGLGGVERDLEMDADGQPNVVLRRVMPETFFYDPRSTKPDFSDARFLGVYKWVDLDAAIEMAPEREEELEQSVNSGGTSYETVAQQDFDKIWFDTRLERVKLVECWYKRRGEWWYALHTGNTVLREGISPFRDPEGKTRCRYTMASAGVDHDGDRYGFIRNMKSSQDEINHRRSKLLWILNTNQVIAEQGAVEDPDAVRRELARPDGWVEFRPSMSGQQPFQVRDLSQQMQGQSALLAEAKGEIDNFGPNPQLLGDASAAASGRAIALQQQAGIAQLGPYFGRFKAWKLAVYREIWNDVRQYWQNPRLLRVAGPQDMQFVPVNQMTVVNGVPQIANCIGDLDIDIVMDEGPDTVTVHEDVMNALTAMINQGLLSGPQALTATLELSSLSPAVKQVIKAAGAPPPPDPQAMQAQQTVQNLQLHAAAAKIAETEARTDKLRADAGAAGAKAQSAAILDQQHAVNTAATIADIGHKIAKTRQIGTETAQAHMAGLGLPAMQAAAVGAPMPPPPVPMPSAPAPAAMPDMSGMPQAMPAPQAPRPYQVLMDTMNRQHGELLAALRAPKRVVRDASGRVAGVQTG